MVWLYQSLSQSSALIFNECNCACFGIALQCSKQVCANRHETEVAGAKCRLHDRGVWWWGRWECDHDTQVNLEISWWELHSTSIIYTVQVRCIIIINIYTHYAFCRIYHSELNALIRSLDEAKREYEASDQFKGFIPRRKRRVEGPLSTLPPPENAPIWAVAPSPSGKCMQSQSCV